nr:L-type lectin-domain containing receptor kinase IX.2-like [Lolium perenne]
MGVIMAVMFAFGMTALLWWGWRKAKACFFPNLIGNLDTGGQEFSYQELVTATNSFSKKLGEGGFGAVFEGKIGDLMVAVKKLSNASESVDGYKAEVTTLSRLNHRNVVPLIGWCHHKRYLLLVYELMPNGSLDTHLHPEKPVLPWIDRYKIAVGLACALAYIHEDSNDSRLVIHKDIKPKNIMIDESFNAKLGDFGLARFVNRGQSAELEPLAGTFGYMDPYSYGTKSDMFSFGVVLLVMGSGRPAIKVVKDDHGTVLESTHIKDIVSGEYGSGGAKAVSDLRLEGNFVPEEMNAMIRVGLLCVSSDSNERPSAKEVFRWLDPPVSLENIPSPRNGGSVSGFPFTTNIDGAWSDSREGAMSSPLLDFPSRAAIQDSNSDRSTAALDNFGSWPAMQKLVEMIVGAMSMRERSFSHGIEKRKLGKKDSIEGTISSPNLDPPSRAVIHDPKSDRSPAARNNGGSSSVPSGELPIAQQKLVEITHLFTGGATGQEDFVSVYKTKAGEMINIFNDNKMLGKED